MIFQARIATDFTDALLLGLRRLSAAWSGRATFMMQSQNALEATNQELEDLVAARTAELRLANAALEKLARCDALTGLPNRLAITERLKQEFGEIRRGKAPYTVLMLDIDFFKHVNDTWGHAGGDAVLRRVATLIQQSIRETDMVGRVGGEEFIILLPMTRLTQAYQVAEKVRSAIEGARIEPAGRVTVSIGLEAALPEQADEEVAVRGADGWLYQAKADGRNRVAPTQVVP